MSEMKWISIEERLQAELDDARVELEEMEECGDLEDRLRAAIRVAKAERAIANLPAPPNEMTQKEEE